MQIRQGTRRGFYPISRPRHRQVLVAHLLWLSAVAGCSQPFTPEQPFVESLVLYGVLTNQSSDQYIRVYTTYGSESQEIGQQGPDTRIADALVLAWDVSTGMGGADTCRYDATTGAYVWSPQAFTRGHEYQIRVVRSGMEPAQARVVVPQQALVAPGSLLTLRDPSNYTADFIVSTRLAPEAKAYIVRLFLEYEYFEGGTWNEGRIEVPKIASGGPGGTVVWVYPSLTRRLGSISGGDTGYQIMSFDHDAYLWALSQVQSRYLAQGLRFQNAVVHLTQVDVHLYNYYNIANGFQDPYTIRTDEPDYTNIDGGYGLIGSAVADSIAIALPEFIR